jgi:pyruvate dehydrogenase E2 component (dihydrolipoamide acetyltransferase)
MAIVDIKIPQMGEGLTEVRLLQFLKQPGDSVQRDELIYTMETDKATLEVESPESGTLVEWLGAEGDILPIGAAVARLDPSATPAADRAGQAASVPAAAPKRPVMSERIIPPRTRAYARERGLSDETLALIPSATAKLMPSDIDAYTSAQAGQPSAQPLRGAETAPSYQDRALPDRQRKLNFHMKRSSQTVIPGTISRPVAWSGLRDYVEKSRGQNPDSHTTEFQVFAYCVVRASGSCPKFRCTLINEDTIRHHDRLNLGVAVALQDGDLTTAVVRQADLLGLSEFVSSLQAQVKAARAGEDQADANVQILLSTLASHGVREAVPVLVAPAAAVLFLGDAYAIEGRLHSNVVLTFDHRLMNGVEAAEMLNAVAEQVTNIGTADHEATM